MKIAIVTLTKGANYGNRLQNYAVENVLKGIGCRAVTLISDFRFADIDALHRCWYLLKRAFKISNYNYTYRQLRFAKFNDQLLSYSGASNANIDSFDYVVYGSDQIWNTHFEASVVADFSFLFGETVPKRKKVAYSASVGTGDIPEEYKKRIAKALRDFHSISVREEQAASIICELTGRKVPVTIDPTLMLDAADWQRIEKKPHYVHKNEKILLTYFLGDLSPARKAFVDAVAQQFGLRVVALQNEWVKDIPDPAVYATTPDEFIWLVHHCQLMLTDSFHGSVFSILFDKPFRCFGREESGVADMSSRMDTLFGKFGIGDWCRGSVQEDPDHIFYKDYVSVPAVLERERQFALDYLKNALEIHE